MMISPFFALAQIESELMLDNPSNLKEVLESVMLEDPKYWQKYYVGDDKAQKLKRAYSYSDRIRYYLPYDQVEAAIETLRHNINHNEILMPVLYQWLPNQYRKVVAGEIQATFEDIVYDCIGEFLDDYIYAIQR